MTLADALLVFIGLAAGVLATTLWDMWRHDSREGWGD